MARRLSLTGTIILYGVLAACIPVVLLGIVFLHIFSSHLENEISQRNLIIARMAAREVDRLLYDCRVMMEFTLGRVMEKLPEVEGRASTELEAMLTKQRIVEGLKLLGPDLTVKTLAPFRKDQLGLDFSGHPFIRRAQGGAAWSGVYLAERTGSPAVSLAVGTKQCVLVADLDLSALEEIAGTMRTAAGGYAAMTDGAGNIIAHPEVSFVRERFNFSNLEVIRQGLAGNEGTYLYKFLGEDRLGSVAVVPQTGWLTVIVQPVRDAFAVVRYGRALMLIILAVLGSVALIVTWYLIKRAVKPMEALADSMRLITKGEYRIKDLPSSYREVDQILQGLGTMAESLERRERELRESEARYRDLFENAVDVIYSINPAGVIVEANDAFFSQGGYKPEDVIGRPLRDFLLFEDRAKAKEVFEQALKGESSSFEMRGKTKDGKPRWYSVVSRPIKGEGGTLISIHCIARDITERKKVEEDLRVSEKRFRDLFDSVSDLVYTQDLEGRFLTVNRALTRISGYGPEEFIGKSPAEFMKPELRGLFLSEYLKELRQKGWTRGTSVYLGKNGNKIYIEFLSNLVTPEHGEPYISGIARDVTERVMALRAIREREERISAILEATPVPIVVYDTEGNLRFINQAFTDVFGWEAAELKGKRVPFVPEEEREKTFAKIRELYSEGRTGAFESKRLTKDGRMLDVLVNGALIKGSSARAMGMVVSLTDLTEQRRLEAVLQEAQKLEALGVLAGGIAHDFNNLLMAIQGNAALMLLDSEPDTASYQRLKDIEKFVEQGAYLTRQLLGFARGGRYEVVPLDLNEVIREHNRVFSRTRKDIVIREEYEEPLWKVEADKGQMQQILMNLYVNAAQAMSEMTDGVFHPMQGGTISVRTQNLFLDRESASPRQLQQGRYVKVTVADTGKGMDRETLGRIFEPFFTTKERGRGTGLGLASVYGIVKNHGGFIEVESEPGRGSEFRLFFPAAGSQVKVIDSEPPSPAKPLKGVGTILLVDDEEMIVGVGRAMLERLGYRVIAACGGEKALEVFSQRSGEIDLVILDMVMPGMSGEAVFEQIKTLKPGVKVLISSGYSMEERARSLMAEGCHGFIQKPFSLASLSEKVKEVMAS